MTGWMVWLEPDLCLVTIPPFEPLPKVITYEGRRYALRPMRRWWIGERMTRVYVAELA